MVLSAKHSLPLILVLLVAANLGVHIGLLTWVCITIFSSHLTPSYCGNKTQIQGERNMQWVLGRPPVWMAKSQITRCGGPLLENLLNNFLREIIEISTCIVAQNPHSQGRFPHLSPKKVKEEG